MLKGSRVPDPYPPEFRARAIVLVRAGRQIKATAYELGISAGCLLGNKIRSAGLMPSFGSVGDGLDNAMTQSFWSSMQIELLNRQKWKTRIELSTAIVEYIEIFHNRQRRHSSLGYRTPIEYELLSQNDPIPA